jgi:hypothetical protein
MTPPELVALKKCQKPNREGGLRECKGAPPTVGLLTQELDRVKNKARLPLEVAPKVSRARWAESY